MPLFDRLIICSAFAATIIYVLYRKRYCPVEAHHTICEEKLVKYQLYTVPRFVEVLSLTYPVGKADLRIGAVTLCTSICLTEPQLRSEEVVTSSSTHIPSLISAEELLEPEETAICDTKPKVDPVMFDRDSTSSESSSEHPRTPDSQISSSGDLQDVLTLPPGYFNDPSNDIYEDSPEELNGTMLPKVLIPSDLWAEAVDQDIWHETFCVPAHMGGVLIGRLGKRRLAVGLPAFPYASFKNTHWESEPVEAVPVHVRSLYASKEFFVTIRDDEYAKYLKMQSELDADYSSATSYRIQLCEPVTSGTVAVVPHSQGFARALVISVYSTWPKSVFYFLLDHGIFGVVALNKLRKIRAKYMRTPFQAIHVSWAHAFPVFSDVPDIHVLRTFFSGGRVHAFAVRMETCCRASVAFGEPYPPPYSSSGLLDILLNAYNSGLYMAVPLAMYPNRQAWLNGTNIPYYPFTYSAIDYPSLVSFVDEDASSPTADGCYDQTKYVQNNAQPKHRAVDSQRRGYAHVRPRPTRGSGAPQGTRRPFVWNQRSSTRGSHPRPYIASQKENENIRCDSVSEAGSKVFANSNATSIEAEPKPKPLGVRNVRGNSTAVPRSNYGRGRGPRSR
ncbi:hypothetical protein D915_000417 [Fasciola hepatica]|uniref:Tudor domain-containing protein n=1 Tax=Fasciola hepatica TaxID=6192 RepID=A0A4E0S456_FASHE|nr:hypothetical protein D915_000417 [Fasciola hepatica]